MTNWHTSEINGQFEAFCNGICEAVAPDYELTFTMRMYGGDLFCHSVVRKRLKARGRVDRPAP